MKNADTAKNNLTKNTLLLSIGTAINKGLAFFMIPLFSSWLSTSDYGTFDIFCTYVTMLIPVLSLSSSEGMFRLGIEKEYKDRKSYITCGLIIFLLGALLFCIISVIIKIVFNWALILSFLFLLISELFNKYFQSFLRTIKKLSYYSIASVFSTVFTFISVTIFIKYLDFGLQGIIYGYAFGYMMANILIIIIGKFPLYLTKNIKIREIKEIILYSLPLIPNTISWWIVNASDRTIIKIFLGVAGNGIYAIAYKLPNLCSSVFSMFGIAWQERAIEMNNSKERDNYYNNVYNKIIKILLSLCGVMLSCNFILFNYVFDQKYFEAHLYAPILVTSIIFSTISTFLGGIQISLKKPKANGITTIIGAVVNIIVHLSLIYFIGLYAAAVSTIVSTISICIIRRYLLRKEVKLEEYKDNKKYILVYIYLCIISFIFNKIPLLINISNLVIAGLMFWFINKKMIIQIIKKMMRLLRRKHA